MPATGTQLIERTRRFMGDWPETDKMTASIASGGTTLTVAATAADRYFVNQMLEIEGEAIMVTSVASTTTLTVMRGLRGTTAASHATALTILQSPRFFTNEYLDAINFGISSCWPWIYRPVIDTSLKFLTDTYEYTIPNMPEPNELSGGESRFEEGVGGWTPSGSNTAAVSSTVSYEGSQSLKMTYQDNINLAVLAGTSAAAIPYRVSAKFYVPTGYDGTIVNFGFANWGNNTLQYSKTVDLTLLDQWQHVEIVGTASSGDLVGSIVVQLTSASVPTAGKFVYMDKVTFGKHLGQIRHVARAEVKVPGGLEWLPRRRWSQRRGGFGANGQPTSKIVFHHLDTVNSQIRLSGFGPFPTLAAKTDVLDPLWPTMAEYPLVEFAASYLMESGEARRVTVDRGLVDQREQANRVGASMQASQALLNRFERRIAAVGMPPMAGYPHVVPYIG